MSKPLKIAAKLNLTLLFFSFLYVFIVGLVEDASIRSYIYSFVFTAIFVISARISSKKNGKKYFIYAGVATAVMWLSDYLDFEYLTLVSYIISILFLTLILTKIVIRISSSQRVGLLEFVEAINVYFLMGVIGSVLFRIVHFFAPGESFNIPGETIEPTIDLIYFSFVTISTLGYGDITPIDPFAKSLAIFLSIAGQLYLTMIIAVLVGKYLSEKQK